MTNPWPKGVAAPAWRALESAGFTKLDDLKRVSEAELSKLHGMGAKAVTALRSALIEKGLSFKKKA